VKGDPRGRVHSQINHNRMPTATDRLTISYAYALQMTIQHAMVNMLALISTCQWSWVPASVWVPL